MIYFDNAATTYPKPQEVYNSVLRAIKLYGANPGRSGHTMSMKAAEEIYKCRSAVKKMFNATSEESVIFTLNCTQAINIILKGYLNSGDHVVISSLEHNAVARPINELKKQNITYTQAQVFPLDNDATVNSFRNAINGSTKLIVCTHASNVWGVRLPIERLTSLAHEYGIKILVDAAQTAGILPIDLQNTKIDFLCMAGHKGLYGVMGTGILITDHAQELRTIIEGGTGSGSHSLEQPELPPERLESGTPNVSGIIGLHAGIRFVSTVNMEKIASHEMMLMRRLYDRLSGISHVQLYTAYPDIKYSVPVLSFNVKGKDSETVAEYLNKNGQIATRAGLHCAPLAHTAFGTMEQGAVRISPSYFNNIREVDRLANLIQKMRINL